MGLSYEELAANGGVCSCLRVFNPVTEASGTRFAQVGVCMFYGMGNPRDCKPGLCPKAREGVINGRRATGG